MPRRRRYYIRGYPYHVVQRGNNKEAVFIQLSDYEHYLELWRICSKRYGVKVHAYCLMTNHVHFIATPEKEISLSLTMKVVGSRYAYHINQTYDRTGTLWEGRHRSSLIDSSSYLLSCYRYVELNPVRAGMVSAPEQYKWSSYGVNAWGDESWIVYHDEYLGLGKDKEARCVAYRKFVQSDCVQGDVDLIRRAAHYCQPVGDDYFCRQIEEKYGLKAGYKKRGRPRNDMIKK